MGMYLSSVRLTPLSPLPGLPHASGWKAIATGSGRLPDGIKVGVGG
jgi:hypothetical protein